MTEQPNRPSLARKHTRASGEKTDDALSSGVRITIDGTDYEVRAGDVTPRVARELRRETGMGFSRLMTEMSSDPDIDLVSAFVWVARRLQGEQVELEDVNIGYKQIMGDDFDIVEAGHEADVLELRSDSPEG